MKTGIGGPAGFGVSFPAGVGALLVSLVSWGVACLNEVSDLVARRERKYRRPAVLQLRGSLNPEKIRSGNIVGRELVGSLSMLRPTLATSWSSSSSGLWWMRSLHGLIGHMMKCNRQRLSALCLSGCWSKRLDSMNYEQEPRPSERDSWGSGPGAGGLYLFPPVLHKNHGLFLHFHCGIALFLQLVAVPIDVTCLSTLVYRTSC